MTVTLFLFNMTSEGGDYFNLTTSQWSGRLLNTRFRREKTNNLGKENNAPLITV